MFLSKLLLNPRSKQVMNEINDPYQMHRTILNAFYNGNEKSGRVLFRVEISKRSPDITLLVQSEREPDWKKIVDKFPAYLSEKENKYEYKKITLSFSNGQRLRFRLRANPTVKKITDGKKNGKRVGILDEQEQKEWMKRKARAGGFKLIDCTVVDEGFVNSQKNSRNLTFLSVKFEGFIEVTETEKFLNCLKSGIGSAKGFGFGLLSIAPA